MKSKDIYLLFCILGAVIPYWQFLRWLMENGFDVSLFVQSLFANRISAFFVLDVLISAVVLLRFVSAEGSRLHLKHGWVVFLSVVLVGVSLGLPLFLYLRERQGEQSATS
jgi:hypothetical protein